MRTLVVAAAVAVVVAAVLGAVASRDGDAETIASTYGTTRVSVELRVWQHVDDGSKIALTAWVAAHGWYTPEPIPLALDDGLSSTGRFRYGDVTVDVPRPEWTSPLGIQTRIWQDVLNDQVIYVSARPVGGSWSTVGTVHLQLDDGFSIDLQDRYGALLLEAPLPRSGVRTLAGQAGRWGYADGAGAEARFGREDRIGYIRLDVDADGSIIVADYHSNAVRRVARDGTVTTIWGGTGPGFRDGPTETAQMAGPAGVAVADDGAIYVADARNQAIRRISPDGIVTTVAGGDTSSFSPDDVIDGPVAEALLGWPRGLALDPDGNLFILELHRVRRLSRDGLVTTVAGDGWAGYQDGPGPAARFHILERIDVDDHGNVYVIDWNGYVPGSLGRGATIRTIDSSGEVRTLFRWAAPSFGGILASPQGLAVTGAGSVYLSNTGRHQILSVTREGALRVAAGTGVGAQLDGPREDAAFRFPGALALTPDGALAVVDQSDSIVRVLVPRGSGLQSGGVAVAGHQPVPRVEGVSVTRIASGTEGPVYFSGPAGMALDSSGNLLVSTSWDAAIRRLAPDGTMTTLAGDNRSGAIDGPGDLAQFRSPWGMAVGADGEIYVADRGNHRIRKIATDGSVTTLATAADGLHHPRSVALDRDGNLLIANTQSIHRLNLESGTVALVHHGSPFIDALAVDRDGTTFFTSTPRPGETAAVMKISSDGVVSAVFTDVAGRYGGVFSESLHGLAVAGDGTLYVSDVIGRVVRIAPDGTASILLDREAFDEGARFNPAGILLMPDGSLVVADDRQHSIWRVTINE